MARKGNKQNNGLDSRGLNHKRGVSLGVLPGMNGHAKEGHVKVFPREELVNGNQAIGLSQNENESSSAGNETNNELKSEKFSRKDKQGMVSKHDLEEPLSFGSNSRDGSLNTEVPTQKENGMSPRSNQGQQSIKNRLSCLLNGLHMKSVVEKVELVDNMTVRRLRLSVSSIFTAVAEWLTRHKPLFVSLTTYIFNARDCLGICISLKLVFHKILPI